MKNRISVIMIILGFLFVFGGCEDLDVKNPNNPTSEDVLSEGSNIQNLAGSVFQNWFIYNCGTVDQPGFMLGGAADASTSSWGNFAMRDMAYEPRIAWNNDPAYGNSASLEGWYDNMNSLLSSANDALKGIEGGDVEVPDEPMVKAVAKFGQGIALGYLSMVFDKSFIVKEDDDISQEFELKSYKEVRQAAISSLDEAIQIADNNSFSIPDAWIQGTDDNYDNAWLSRMANFMAAKILISSARNEKETQNLNWSDILTYAQNGLDRDYTIIADPNEWYSQYHYYNSNNIWNRVDMRIVDMLDTGDIPPKWHTEYLADYTKFPNDGEIKSNDNRVEEDFVYLTNQFFSPDRGYYFFSTYRYTRFDDFRESGYPGTGPITPFRKAENDYMLAEAYARTGSPGQAQSVLNSSARVNRGGSELEVTTTDVDKLLDIVYYERHIELFHHNLGIQYFDMRRFGQLQKGTPTQFPIPGAELETLLMDNYTFGGAKNAGEEGAADEGWKVDYENNYGDSGPYYNFHWQ